VKNSSNQDHRQQRGDLAALTNHLYLNDVVLKAIKGLAHPRKDESAGRLSLLSAERAETTEVIRLVPTSVDY